MTTVFIDRRYHRPSTEHLPHAGEGYWRWLFAYAQHVAVLLAAKHDGWTMDELITVVERDGVLDGFNRRGDTWAMRVVNALGFEKVPKSLDRYRPTSRLSATEDFPHPGPAPELAAKAWTMPARAKPAAPADPPPEPEAKVKRRKPRDP